MVVITCNGEGRREGRKGRVKLLITDLEQFGSVPIHKCCRSSDAQC